MWERGLATEQVATLLLKKREGAVATGQPVMPRLEKISYEEIREDLRQHYTATQERDLVEYGHRLKHLDAFFAGRRVATIRGADATDYTVKRQGQEPRADHPA